MAVKWRGARRARSHLRGRGHLRRHRRRRRGLGWRRSCHGWRRRWRAGLGSRGAALADSQAAIHLLLNRPGRGEPDVAVMLLGVGGRGRGRPCSLRRWWRWRSRRRRRRRRRFWRGMRRDWRRCRRGRATTAMLRTTPHLSTQSPIGSIAMTTILRTRDLDRRRCDHRIRRGGRGGGGGHLADVHHERSQQENRHQHQWNGHAEAAAPRAHRTC